MQLSMQIALATARTLGGGRLAKSSNGVDLTDSLGQKGIGCELGELAAPQVRGQNLHRGCPVARICQPELLLQMDSHHLSAPDRGSSD